MESTKMKAALYIIDECDVLSITEDDKAMIVSVFGEIISELKGYGLALKTEINVQYAILKESVWSNGYFCEVARKMCFILYPYVKILERM